MYPHDTRITTTINSRSNNRSSNRELTVPHSRIMATRVSDSSPSAAETASSGSMDILDSWRSLKKKKRKRKEEKGGMQDNGEPSLPSHCESDDIEQWLRDTGTVIIDFRWGFRGRRVQSIADLSKLKCRGRFSSTRTNKRDKDWMYHPINLSNK